MLSSDKVLRGLGRVVRRVERGLAALEAVRAEFADDYAALPERYAERLRLSREA